MTDEAATLIKVGRQSPPGAVAGAIAGVLRQRGSATVQAIGVGAVYQSVKALIMARSFLEQDHLKLVFVPVLVDLQVEGKERTAVRMLVTASPAPAAEG